MQAMDKMYANIVSVKPYNQICGRIRIRIRIIYLTSETQGVVAQSPEPGAHDTIV